MLVKAAVINITVTESTVIIIRLHTGCTNNITVREKMTNKHDIQHGYKNDKT